MGRLEGDLLRITTMGVLDIVVCAWILLCCVLFLNLRNTVGCCYLFSPGSDNWITGARLKIVDLVSITSEKEHIRAKYRVLDIIQKDTQNKEKGKTSEQEQQTQKQKRRHSATRTNLPTQSIQYCTVQQAWKLSTRYNNSLLTEEKIAVKLQYSRSREGGYCCRIIVNSNFTIQFFSFVFYNVWLWK